MKKVFFILTLAFIAANNPIFSAITANPIISRGKPVYTSSGKAQYLVDDKFNTTMFNVSDNSWIAIQVDSGYSKVFFNWNNPAYPWSNELAPAKCPNTESFPVDYNLLISSNSTNGADGDWKIADSIRGNIVTTRGHLINFSKSSWVKMQIIKGGGKLDEIEVFDASNGNSDVWFFAGTSISANAFKATPPSQNYADLVTSSHPGYNPAMIRGGIGCINSSDFVNNLPKYLKMAGNAHYWAIEMGTNDAWNNGNSNVATFKNNLQKVIDSCKAHGIEPIIAYVLATNAKVTGWQVDTDYYGAVEDLNINNNLISGPDLYSWFLAHPKELNSDGVHPNATGAASIQRLWAQTMTSLYVCATSEVKSNYKVNSGASTMKDSVTIFSGDTLVLSPQATYPGGSWTWSGPSGIKSTSPEVVIDSARTNQSGNYLVIYKMSPSCLSSCKFNVKVTARPVEIKLPSKLSGINIFPNPTEGNFKILLNNFSGATQLRIYNILGKLIYNSVLLNEETEIDSKLPQGIYIINIAQNQIISNKTLIIR